MKSRDRFVLWIAAAIVSLSLSASVSSAQLVIEPGKPRVKVILVPGKARPAVTPIVTSVPYQTGYTFLGSPTYPGGGFNADARPNYFFYYGVDFQSSTTAITTTPGYRR